MRQPDSEVRRRDGAAALVQPAPIWVRFLHLGALTALALAQPLFDLLAKAPEFFVVHRSEPGDVVKLVLLASLAVPCLGIAVEWVAALASRRLSGAIHLFLVATLVAVLVLGAIRNIKGVASVAIVAMALASGVVGAFLYQRSAKLRSFATLLSVAAIAFPALFLLRPPISELVFEPPRQTTSAVRSDLETPIVMVVFDEVPLSSLLQKDSRINSRLYPNFASLAATSDWFTNATSIAATTELAVPAILTGRYPRGRPARTLPESLFTLVGASHELVVFEQSWTHCPEDLCRDPLDRISDADRFRFLFSDVTVLYQHLLWPLPARRTLPPIDLAWGDFRDLKEDGPQRTDALAFMERFVGSIDRNEQPAFYYLHPNFPHMPWKHLPSGSQYGPLSIRYRPFGLPGRRWSDEEHYVQQGWQRHLLQVRLADRILGQVIDKLKSEGLFDKALVIICSDHGASFVPGEYYRRGILDSPNAADVLSVPLLIKRPQQTVGRTRPEAVETIDILPTVADLLEVSPPWETDGRSLLGETIESRTSKTAFEKLTLRRVVYSDASLGVQSTVERKVAIFGEEPDGLFAYGSSKELVGQPVEHFQSRPAAGLEAVLHGELEYERVALDSGFVPAFIVGRLLHDEALPSGSDLAIAVNGRVRTGAKLMSTAPGEGEFAALVPEESFRSGRNDIEVFLVERTSDGVTLARAERPESESYVLAAATIESSGGKLWSLGSSSLRGSVEQKNWELVGWAADRPNLLPAERILVFVDGQFLLSAPVREPSPRLARTHGAPLATSGFRFMIPFSKIPPRASVRLFAVAGQSAVELRYGKSFRLGMPSDPGSSTDSADADAHETRP